ncbi:prepilin-type N-terminal cleavage/methylation domain-containing protein [Candidatus Parcubacteria bacterium]|nr:prepilin-type N-terminal cleavage/methylation domain-containing protein [Candidatus Parcubacteria bacterium]
MTKLNEKGFTLIELLVVIAIIGILASIVLVSLNDARNRGYDAEIKAELAQIRNAVEMFYDDEGGTYTLASLAGMGVSNLGTPNCSSDDDYQITTDATGYAIHVDLCGTDYDWCMDATGISKNTASAVVGTSVACP